jgi:hypothetical protein
MDQPYLEEAEPGPAQTRQGLVRVVCVVCTM